MRLVTYVEVINDKMLHTVKARIVVTFVRSEGVEMVIRKTEGLLVLAKFYFFVWLLL